MLLIKRFETLQIQDKAPKAAGNQCCGFMWFGHIRVGQNSMRRASGKKPLLEPLLRLSASAQSSRSLSGAAQGNNNRKPGSVGVSAYVVVPERTYYSFYDNSELIPAAEKSNSNHFKK